jgi:hypothetical protein
MRQQHRTKRIDFRKPRWLKTQRLPRDSDGFDA